MSKRTILKAAGKKGKGGRRRKPPPPAAVVSQIVDGLLSKFDPVNTSWEEFERSKGETVRGIRCRHLRRKPLLRRSLRLKGWPGKPPCCGPCAVPTRGRTPQRYT
jgi:hypothetical protein